MPAVTPVDDLTLYPDKTADAAFDPGTEDLRWIRQDANRVKQYLADIVTNLNLKRENYTSARIEVGDVTILPADNGGIILVAMTAPYTVTFAHDLPVSFEVTIVRSHAGAPETDPGHALSFVGTGGVDPHLFIPEDKLTITYQVAKVTKMLDPSMGPGLPYGWSVMTSNPVDTQITITSSRNLNNRDTGKTLVLDTTAGAIVLTAPTTLRPDWRTRIIRRGANLASIVGSGGVSAVGRVARGGRVDIRSTDLITELTRVSATEVLADGTWEVPTVGLTGFSAANYYQGVAGDMRGLSTGFAVSAMFSMLTLPTVLSIIFANFNQFQPDGGYCLAVNDSHFTFGLGRQSDSTVLFSTPGSGPSHFSSYMGRKLRRLYNVVLNYDGTIGTLWVNGEPTSTYTPAGGYQLADVALTPYIGRNTNAGAPSPGTDLAVMGIGYKAVALTSDQIRDHFKACYNACTFQNDIGSGGTFDSAYLDLDPTAASISDVMAASGVLTRNGTIGTEALRPVW